MGMAFIGLAFAWIGIAYLTPHTYLTIGQWTLPWLSPSHKEGVYALSALFLFLGLYCLGATWRRRHFI
jgi:hypothetical protein